MMKKFVFILALILLLGSCGKATAPIADINGGTKILAEGTNIEKIVEPSYDTLDEILDYSTSLAKVKVLAAENFEISTPTVRYTCEVISDYFGNIDYYGSSEGQIYVYEAPETFKNGDIYYLFMGGRESKIYPHIVYTTADKLFCVTETADGLEFFTDFRRYGLEKDSDIDFLIKEYIEKTDLSKKTLAYLPKVNSCDDMLALATDIWYVEAVSKAERQHPYMGTMLLEIREVLRGDYKLDEDGALQNFYQIVVPKEAPYEEGKEYLVLQGYRDGIEEATIISYEFGILSYDSVEAAEIISKLKG